MAEAVLDEEHPLADYLLDAGDAPAELMPGGAAEFLVVETETDTNIWLPPFILPLLETVHEMTQSHRSRSAAREFAERFKYVIISSSLLSSTLAPPASATIRPQPRSSSPLPPTPGKWNDPQLAVGRPENISLWTISLCIAPAALLQGYYIGALLILATARLYETNGMADSTRQASLLQNLEALDSLIAAGNFWDSVVCEAMSILEKEERTLFYGTATPGSPSSSLRVALHSTLQTTTTQCDNVRQLFSPLTSPTELAQMTEMYAPLTPLKSTFSAHTNFFDNPRPLSLSGSPSHWVPPSSAGPSTPTPMADKRATWNGQQQMIKDRRRSALATLLGEHASPMARSQPPTPRGFDDDEPFGVTALDLTRNKRRSLRLTGTGGYSTPISATGSSSRFTAMQTTRHPLSLSSLNHALQAAMSSKRYSASHLLALRFGEEEEEYWEDVRSVISLLTTTLEDAASRLSEALEESVRKQRLEDEPLSTPLTQQAGGILSYSDSPSLARTFSLRRNMHQRGAQAGITASTSLSFAPMPSRLLKFSSHVDAIASALDIAKERLQECMTALQEEQTRAQLLTQSGDEPTEGEDGPSRADLESAARAALESYENVRRELGFALRECERAREPLWDVVGVKASSSSGANDEGDTPDLVRDVEEDGDEDDVPALAHDSSDSEPSRGSRGTVDLAYLASALAAAGQSGSSNDGHGHHMDDFAPLPPATGLEQVFEADSAPVGAFNRERSKMTREERIAAAKAKRDSGLGGSGSRDVASTTMGGHGEVWGPGGEVVQELRDVIWKVGEKRRKVQEEHQQSTLLESAQVTTTSTPDEPSSTSSMLRNRPRAPTRSVPAAPSQSIGSEVEMQLGKLRSMVSQAERGLGISIPSPVTPSTPYATTSAGGLTVASGASPYTPASNGPGGVGGPSIEDLRAMVASVASKASSSTSPLIVEPTEDVFGPTHVHTSSSSSAPIDITAKAQRRYSRQPVVGVAASATGTGPRVSFSRPLSGSYASAYSAAYSTGSQSPSASSSASFGSPLGSPSAAYNTLPSISSTTSGAGGGSSVRHRTSNSSLSSFLRTARLEPIPDPEGDEEEFEEASEVLLEADEEGEEEEEDGHGAIGAQFLGVAL